MDELNTQLNDEIRGNCVTGRFTNFFGEDHQYVGEMKSKSGDIFAKYIIKNLATGENADGSSASGYPINVGLFRALCPMKAPPDEGSHSTLAIFPFLPSGRCPPIRLTAAL
jgi:hypothetical protein